MIPVYLIVALLGFLMFKFYIHANTLTIMFLVCPLVIIAIASMKYNANRKEK